MARGTWARQEAKSSLDMCRKFGVEVSLTDLGVGEVGVSEAVSELVLLEVRLGLLLAFCVLIPFDSAFFGWVTSFDLLAVALPV